MIRDDPPPAQAASTSTGATLVFDGDCGICREWVDYWACLTGGKIDYRPYQEVAADYPQITRAQFEAAIQLIDANGAVCSGAQAAYSLYRAHSPRSLLLWLYRHIPGFAAASEYAYAFFSAHRGLLAFITHLCWGRNFRPPQYHQVCWLYLRLLGGVYLAAFLSFAVQADGLIGSQGIVPVASYLAYARDQLGAAAWLRLPTLFWLHASDGSIALVCWAGVFLSVCLIMNFLQRTALVLLYVLYLSLVIGAQVFMSFQWDVLLLECGFLGIFLPFGSGFIPWLYRWLLFRFMFMGGMVKVNSGDPAWHDFTALNYHFETQPLPSPLAWYAGHLPEALLKFGTGATLFIELFMPFLIFCPRRLRQLAALGFIALQSSIILTGNYNFFNLLTLCMCLFLFDDAAIGHVLPRRLQRHIQATRLPAPGNTASACAVVLALTVLYISAFQLYAVSSGNRDVSFPAVYRWLAPFSIINSYGPFAVMTRVRNEIIIEGSDDRTHWREYQFRDKPGDTAACPGWVIPHQPRLDWQMWFAALGRPEQQPWFTNLLIRLLQNSAPVTALLAYNPFPDRAPASIRARYYHYSFTSPAQRRATGRCWNRKLLGDYYPPVSLHLRRESN